MLRNWKLNINIIFLYLRTIIFSKQWTNKQNTIPSLINILFDYAVQITKSQEISI